MPHNLALFAMAEVNDTKPQSVGPVPPPPPLQPLSPQIGVGPDVVDVSSRFWDRRRR